MYHEGGEEECIQDIGGKARREIGWDGIYWIDMAQDRDQWRTLVNTVMNLRVP
jgi:dissimilatory sulfite reductase (desulfoviridin) alpha/beta subunit